MDIPDAFTVVVPSAINNAELMLGWGRSEQAALEDAFQALSSMAVSILSAVPSQTLIFLRKMCVHPACCAARVPQQRILRIPAQVVLGRETLVSGSPQPWMQRSLPSKPMAISFPATKVLPTWYRGPMLVSPTRVSTSQVAALPWPSLASPLSLWRSHQEPSHVVRSDEYCGMEFWKILRMLAAQP